MTRKECTRAKMLVAKFDELDMEIAAADAIIDDIDHYITILNGDCEGMDVYVIFCINGGVSHKLTFTVEQLTKLRELIDSCRSDACKRQEEI